MESDKADMDVESFNDGILGAIVISEGGVANVGEPIAYIAESEADLEAAKSKAGSGASASNGAAPAQVPFSFFAVLHMKHCINACIKGLGLKFVQPKEQQIEAPKPELVAAAVEAPAKPAPAASATTTAPPPPPPPAPAAPAPQKRADGRVIATPYAKKLAKDLGVDLARIAGSGPAGRITASDVEAFKGNGGEPFSPVNLSGRKTSMSVSLSTFAKHDGGL